MNIMKKVVLILSVVLFAGISDLMAQEETSSKEIKKNEKISEVSLSCQMDCGNCSDKVKKQLAYTKGVKFVSTDFEKDVVVVKYRNDRTDVDKIIASLGEIDYKASVKKACCSGSAKTGGCSDKAKDAAKSGCETSNASAQPKAGCGSTTHAGCSGKKTE
jgi:copper chaperone CopZ